jgi:tetratricopeptide (TPR) repeat protein
MNLMRQWKILNHMKMNKIIFLLLILSISCYRVPDKIEPKINHKLEENYINKLKPAFAPIDPQDREKNWAKEYMIATRFAKDMELYRAVSTFKRAEFLLPEEDSEKILDIQYNILLCYFLGERYLDVINLFEKTKLAHVDKSFIPYHDLLVILYASYLKTDNCNLAEQVLKLLYRDFPNTAKKLQISQAFTNANIVEIKQLSKNTTYENDAGILLNSYSHRKKSIAKAKGFNALLPGSGYLYVGQKKAAVTSFFMNALFIGAAVHFFSKGEIAAGAITTSFELGWYFGGIHGAGLEARYYNERIYEDMASKVMNHHKLFPVFTLKYGF